MSLGAGWEPPAAGTVPPWCARGGRAMARAYTAELRDRVLRACERGGLSRGAIAKLFGVGESTLYRWQQTWRTEGRREARPHAGGPAPRLDEAALDRLKELAAEANDRTLAEYAAALRERAGVEASGPTVCRALRKLGLTRKKGAAGRGAGPARAGRGPRRGAGRAGRDRDAAPGGRGGVRRRPPDDPGLRPRPTGAAGRGHGALGPLEAAHRARRPGPRRGGRRDEHRRRDRHARLPRLRRAGAHSGSASVSI